MTQTSHSRMGPTLLDCTIMGKLLFKFFSENEQPFLGILNTINVNTNVRPLRALWTPELTQDVESIYGFDSVQEVINRLSEEIAIEIDREILSNLLSLEYLPHRETYGDLYIDRESKLKKIKRFKFLHTIRYDDSL